LVWDSGSSNDEGGAFARNADGIDRAQVALDDLAAGGEADAGAFILGAAVQALEDHEDLLLELLLEADAVVGDFDDDGGALPGRSCVSVNSAVIFTTGSTSFLRNLMALPIRFWKSWRICIGRPR
jgi:hypothetical protein